MDVSISAGRFRGKKLRIPKNSEDFRPTKAKVKEAVCSSLMMDTTDASVLELCGGSGVVSLELISRGATSATIVELSLKRTKLIENVCADLSLSDSITVINADVTSVIPTLSEQFDIIFFDPPYYTDDIANLIPAALEHLKPYGVLVFESASDDMYIDSIVIPSKYKIKQKKYGQTMIRYYRSKE